jgi:uncharacterized protein YegJ (DUF2314 family)
LTDPSPGRFIVPDLLLIPMKSQRPLLLVSLVLLAACDSKKSAPEIVHREGRPDYIRLTDKDEEMNKAIQTARDTVRTFIAALNKPGPNQGSFNVKKPFTYGNGNDAEHIWLSDASFDGIVFKGRVGNEPVDVKNVKLGQMATVSKSEISDWFYIDNGKLVGGYTIRVLYSRMSPEEKKDFNEHAGMKIE